MCQEKNIDLFRFLCVLQFYIYLLDHLRQHVPFASLRPGFPFPQREKQKEKRYAKTDNNLFRFNTFCFLVVFFFFVSFVIFAKV